MEIDLLCRVDQAKRIHHLYGQPIRNSGSAALLDPPYIIIFITSELEEYIIPKLIKCNGSMLVAVHNLY